MFSFISLIYRTLTTPIHVSILSLILLMLFSLITWAALFLLLKHSFNYYFPHMTSQRNSYPVESFDLPVYTCTSLPEVVCKAKDDDPPNYYDLQSKSSKSLPSYEDAQYMKSAKRSHNIKTQLSV